jgi:hypothetical protein
MQCAIDPNTEDCTLGANAVSQMDLVFQSAPPDIQTAFQSAHDTIMVSFNQNNAWYNTWIPFNPVCETICGIGQQAESLMNQIQVAMGQSPTPITSGSGTNIVNIVILVGVGYLALVYMAGHHA